MSNEVNQAYLRAYVKSRAEGAPVRSRLPSSGGNPDSEPIRRPVTQRVDAGTQQVPAPNLPIAPHRPAVSPTQKEVLRQEAAKSVEQPLQPQQSGAWSSLGVERGIKATGVFRAQPAVVVNGAGAVRHVVHDSDSIPQMHRSKPESTSDLRPRAMPAGLKNRSDQWLRSPSRCLRRTVFLPLPRFESIAHIRECLTIGSDPKLLQVLPWLMCRLQQISTQLPMLSRRT
jgi:hypothetical protein